MLDDTEIISECNDPNRHIIGGFAGATEIVYLTCDLVVKVGDVRQEEAASQQAAYDLLDPRILIILRVCRFFEHDGRGFLVMDYVKGQRRCQIEDHDSLSRISEALCHLHKQRSLSPGPPGGSSTSGILWPDDRQITFRSKTDIEDFLNRRLFNSTSKLDFQDEPLVFCHLDIAPRNFIWLEDDRLCLVDWAHAGYYPLAFEHSALAINIYDYENDYIFTELLTQVMSPLNETQKEQSQLVLRARYNSIRFHL